MAGTKTKKASGAKKVAPKLRKKPKYSGKTPKFKSKPRKKPKYSGKTPKSKSKPKIPKGVDPGMIDTDTYLKGLQETKRKVQANKNKRARQKYIKKIENMSTEEIKKYRRQRDMNRIQKRYRQNAPIRKLERKLGRRRA